jgi:hypothetical protein
MEKTTKKPLSWIHGPSMPFLALLLFAGLYFATFKLFPASVADISSERILEPFQKYGAYGGVAAGLLSMLGMYVLYIFRALFRLNRFRFSAPFVLMLGYAPWAAFGYQLVYREPRYAMIAKAIISFTGKPLLYAGSTMVVFGLTWFILNFFIRSASK